MFCFFRSGRNPQGLPADTLTMARPVRHDVERTRRSVTATRARIEQTQRTIAHSRRLARAAAEEAARLPGLRVPSEFSSCPCAVPADRAPADSRDG